MTNEEKITNVAEHYLAIMQTLGWDVEDAHLLDTPRRVAKMWVNELSTKKEFELRAFPNIEGYEQLIIVRDINVYSICSHHLVPFFGTVQIGYIPNESLIGLSKISRLVDKHACVPQIQERLTLEICRELFAIAKPHGCVVRMAARHLCTEMRGVSKPGSVTITMEAMGNIDCDSFMRALHD